MGELRTSAALVATALVVVLGGCADDAPQGDPEIIQVEPSEESPSEAPGESEPATEEPPAMPAAAKAASFDGARAFVRHWVEVFNFATGTGETDGVNELSSPDCRGCEAVITAIDDVYSTGGRIESDGWDVRRVAETAGQKADSPVLAVRILRNPQDVRSGDGNTETYDGGMSSYLFGLTRSDDEWLASRVEILD